MSENQPGLLQKVVMALVDGAWRHAAIVLMIAVVVTAGAAFYAVNNFEITTDRKEMLAEDLPFRQAFREYQRAFPGLADNVVVVIDAESPRAANGVARRLAERVQADPEHFVSIDLAAADPFFEERGWLYLPADQADAVVDQVTKAAPSMALVARDPTPGGLFDLMYRRLRYADRSESASGSSQDLHLAFGGLVDGLRAALSGDGAPVSWSQMATPESVQRYAREREEGPGRVVALIEPRLDYSRMFAARPALDQLRMLADELGIEEHPQRSFRMTGGLAMAAEELRTVASGMEWIGALVLGVVAIILLMALRSVPMVLAVVTTLLMGLVVTGGWAMLTVGHLNMVSVVFGVLYLGLGVDYAIHLCMRYRELLAKLSDRRAAMVEAAGDVGGSLVVCAITTAIGFFAFIPTDYTGVSELGFISGTGMLISLVASLTVLPALLRWLSPHAGAVNTPHLEDQIQQGVVAALVKHRTMVLAVCACLGGAAVVLARDVQFDANVLNLRDASSESVATFDELLRTSDKPPWTITVLADDAEAAAAKAQALSELDAVAEVVHLGRFLPQDQPQRLRQRDDIAGLLEPALAQWGRDERPSVEQQVESARDLHWLLEKALSRGADRPELYELHVFIGELLERSDAASLGERGALWHHVEQTLFADFEPTLERLAHLTDVEEVGEDTLPQAIRERWVGTDGVYRLEVFPSGAVADDW